MNVYGQSDIQSASGDSLPDIPLRGLHLHEELLDGSVGEKSTSPSITEVAVVVVFRLGLSPCLGRLLYSKLFISGIYYYTCQDIVGSLKVYIANGFSPG